MRTLRSLPNSESRLRALFVLTVCAAWISTPLARSQDSESESVPIDSGIEEKTDVRLVLLDLVVVDKDGSTVPDLTADDFEIVANGDVRAVDTLDVDCDAGALAEPRAVRRAHRRPGVDDPGRAPKIVLAFDYMHLAPGEREYAFQQAEEMVENGAVDGEEIMIAALTGGLRIEQGFTGDSREVSGSLQRMHHDVTLWNGNFTHRHERGFVLGMKALFDVLGTVPGPKSVVLFSGMRDVPLENEFRELAAVAAGARCALYPVDASGLRAELPGGGNARPG